MVAKAIERFASQAPAATMFVGLLSRVFSNESLDKIFRDHSQHQVESPILFSYLVEMLTPVVVGKTKSVNTSHRELGLNVSRQAVYDKLKGVEAEVSSAMVRETSRQLMQICDLARIDQDDPIPGYACFILDGKTYNATEHRLIETRKDSRCPLPGRCISVLDASHGLFVDVEVDPNANRCERRIVDRMMPRLSKGAVYIADRNFCDGNLIEQFVDAGSYFVIRLHGASPARREILGGKSKETRKVTGERITERELEVELPKRGWTKVRLITVHLTTKTRNGDRVIHIISNLPKSVSGIAISKAYRRRWTIENSFGYISRCLNAEIRTLCYPAAAGLCFSLALLLYNVMRAISLFLSAFGKQPKAATKIELSLHYIASEISSCYAGLLIAADEKDWKPILSLSLTKFVAWLKQVASYARLSKYKKDPRGPKKKPPARTFNGSRHIATQLILNARK